MKFAIRSSVPARTLAALAGLTAGLAAQQPSAFATQAGSAASLPFTCITTLEDASTGACLAASSVPTAGMLYPLGTEWYIDGVTGNVGLGTTTPSENLQIGEYFVTAEDNYIELRTIGGTGNEYHQGLKMRSSNPFFGFDIEHDDAMKGLNVRRWDADFGSFGDSALFVDREAGYLGVGTTLPIAEIEIIGNDGNNADLRLQRSGETHGYNLAAGFDRFFLTRNDGVTFENHLIVDGLTGNVAIGDFSASEKLDVDGNVRCVSLIQTSDERYKTDVRELDDALATVRALRGVSYEWDRDVLPSASEGRKVGFLAQEVREVLPEAVHENADGYLGVAYSEVVPVLVEAMQELETNIDSLRTRNEALARRLAEYETLAAEMAAFKSELAALQR